MAGTSIALGIDVGGSGIKGAPVDLDRGEFAAERIRIETPAVSSPLAVCEVIAEIVERFDGSPRHAPIGVTIPGVVTHGVVRSAANIDPEWIGFDAERHLHDVLEHPVVVVNDADAAGSARCTTGGRAARPGGLVIITTLGTGMGPRSSTTGCSSQLRARPPRDRRLRRRDPGSHGAREARTSRGRSGGPGCSSTTATSRRCAVARLFVVGGGVSKKADGSCRC